MAAKRKKKLTKGSGPAASGPANGPVGRKSAVGAPADFDAFEELLLRLGRGRDATPPAVRFASLAEISGFKQRWSAVSDSIWPKATSVVECASEVFRRILNLPGGHHRSAAVDAAQRSFAGGVFRFRSAVFGFGGIPVAISSNVSKDQLNGVFKEIRCVMDGWTPAELMEVCGLFGIGIVLPLSDAGSRRGPLSEPKFRLLSSSGDASKDWMQDAIAVLLITMSPQSMLYDPKMPKGELGGLGLSHAKSPFYVLRWLEALSDPCAAPDGEGIVARRTLELLRAEGSPSQPSADGAPRPKARTSMATLVALGPGFRLYNALGKAAFLEEKLKVMCTSYDAVCQYLKIHITGAVPSTNLKELSWKALRRVSDRMLEHFAAQLQLLPDRFQTAEMRVYQKCTEEGDNPEAYCCAMIRLLESVQARRTAAVTAAASVAAKAAANPPARASQSGGAGKGIPPHPPRLPSAPRAHAARKPAPRPVPVQAAAEEVCVLDPEEVATFKAEMQMKYSAEQPDAVAEPAVAPSQTAMRPRSVRENCFTALCSFHLNHRTPNPANAARLMELLMFSNCNNEMAVYVEIFQALIDFMHVALSRKIPFDNALHIFNSETNLSVSSWKEYGDRMISRALALQEEPSAGEPLRVPRQPARGLGPHNNWDTIRTRNHRQILGSLHAVRHVAVDLTTLSRSLEKFIFVRSGGYEGTLERYRKIWTIFRAFLAASIRENLVPLYSSINEFGLILFEKTRGDSADAEKEHTQYARVICLEILSQLFKDMNIPESVALDATLRLWGEFPDRRAFIAHFQEVMSRMLHWVGTGRGADGFNASLNSITGVAKAIELHESDSASTAVTQAVAAPQAVGSPVQPVSLPASESRAQSAVGAAAGSGDDVGSETDSIAVTSAPTNNSSSSDSGSCSITGSVPMAAAVDPPPPAAVVPFGDEERYAVLVGLYIFGNKPARIATLTNRSADEIEAYIDDGISPDAFDTAVRSGVVPAPEPLGGLEEINALAAAREPGSGVDLWATFGRPVLAACMCLQPAITDKAVLSAESRQVLDSFFRSLTEQAVLASASKPSVSEEVGALYADAVEIIARWYKSFHEKFVKSFNSFVEGYEAAAKKVRVIEFAMKSVSSDSGLDRMKTQLAEAEKELSRALQKMRLLIDMRVSANVAIILNMELPADAQLVRLAITPSPN